MRRPQLTLSDHLKKKLRGYHHQFFVYTYRVSNSLAGIDFQQFLKNKNCLTNYSNAVQAIVSRFYVQVSNHNTLLVFFWSDQIEAKWPPWLSILKTSDQLKEKLLIYYHQNLYTDIRLHKLGWYWFSAILPLQPICQKYCLTNYIMQCLFKLLSPDLTCR